MDIQDASTRSIGARMERKWLVREMIRNYVFGKRAGMGIDWLMR